MERRVKVNAGTRAAVTPDGLPQGWSQPDWSAGQTLEKGGKYPTQDRGPCLYLGPGGKRCRRLALADGFCAAHGPHRPERPTARPVRFWAVAALIAALLWPYLEVAVREIIGWARSH
jgi:hypothetical protein